MNWRISFLIIFLSLVSCNSKKSSEETLNDASYLISVEEFLKISDTKNMKIIDFRKKKDFKEGHLKNAIHLWRTDIENPSYPYKGMMPTPKQIEKLFSNKGIFSNDRIVIYDDNGLCEAARLWWILQNYNFKNVKLLHGGIKKWKSLNGEITRKKTSFNKTVFKLPSTKPMHLFASKENVLQAIKSNSLLIDTRNKNEFSGKTHKNGALRPGRIPNSIHIDWAQAIDFYGTKLIKPVEELDKIYKKLNTHKNDTIILYCHSGVRSAHTTFILTQILGYKNVKNYDGSWVEWSHLKNNPYINDYKSNNTFKK